MVADQIHSIQHPTTVSYADTLKLVCLRAYMHTAVYYDSFSQFIHLDFQEIKLCEWALYWTLHLRPEFSAPCSGPYQEGKNSPAAKRMEGKMSSLPAAEPLTCYSYQVPPVMCVLHWVPLSAQFAQDRPLHEVGLICPCSSSGPDKTVHSL